MSKICFQLHLPESSFPLTLSEIAPKYGRSKHVSRSICYFFPGTKLTALSSCSIYDLILDFGGQVCL